jgi:hypothetical protein
VPEVSEVMEVMEAGEVVKVSEVMVWEHHGMVSSPSGGHVWAAAKATHAAHTARAVHAAHTARAVHAAHTARAAHAAHHRMGRHRWRGKHRHHDSGSNNHFAEHDDPPVCHPLPIGGERNGTQNVRLLMI